MTTTTDAERRERYAAAIRRACENAYASNSQMAEDEIAAVAAMAVADAELRVGLGEQADQYMASVSRLSDLVTEAEQENARLRAEFAGADKHAPPAEGTR